MFFFSFSFFALQSEQLCDPGSLTCFSDLLSSSSADGSSAGLRQHQRLGQKKEAFASKNHPRLRREPVSPGWQKAAAEKYLCKLRQKSGEHGKASCLYLEGVLFRVGLRHLERRRRGAFQLIAAI